MMCSAYLYILLYLYDFLYNFNLIYCCYQLITFRKDNNSFNVHVNKCNLQAVSALENFGQQKDFVWYFSDEETGGGGRLRDEYWGVYIFLRCLLCQFYDIWSYILYWDHGPEIWTLTVKKVSSKIIWLDRVVAQVLGSQNRTTRAAWFQFLKAITVQLYKSI